MEVGSKPTRLQPAGLPSTEHVALAQRFYVTSGDVTGDFTSVVGYGAGVVLKGEIKA